MEKRRLGIVLAGLAIGLVATTGCGDEADPTASESTPADKKPERPSGLRLLAAERTVQTYYEGIDSGRYATAWRYLAREPRIELEGFANWRAGHEGTVESDVQTLTASRIGSNSASVRVRLNTVDLNDCGEGVPQSFTGTWIVEVIGGIATMTDPDIEKVSGEDPSAPCESVIVEPPPPPPPPPPPVADECDPSYEGECLDPNSFDYDCASGTGDGPDYVAGPISVVGDDHFGLDADSDGTACES